MNNNFNEYYLNKIIIRIYFSSSDICSLRLFLSVHTDF